MDFVKSEIKNIVVFVAILAGLYFGYTYFFPESAPLTTTSSPSGGPASVGGDVLPILLELKKISLNQTIFTDPIFQNLNNYSTELGHEDAGRPDPFAPVGGAADAGTSTVSIKTKIN